MNENQAAREFEIYEELFNLVVDLPADERERILAQRDLGAETRARLDIMLEGAGLPLPEVSPATDASLVGQQLGVFRLAQFLGAGGVGAVYLAERTITGEPHRVAVKVLAPHAAGPDFVRRFEREQQHLAALDHPHIARLIESGVSAEGQPYLAMEYVDGTPLDRYCDERKLDLRTRIELLLQVCDAVSSAHRSLILHLDIKPSNILVTKEGSVKLLDFGTSRLIAGEGMLTTVMMGTPAFASPEQLRNDPLTTACDVYSLGAVLYELLSGRRVVENVSLGSLMERILQEKEPAPLEQTLTEEAAAARGVSSSRLRQMLRGDLSTIVARCMRSRAEARYPTVDALADDLRRYLDGREVLARPQTATYRIGKYARRHAKGLSAVAATLLVVTGLLGYAAWRQEQALREGERAEKMQSFLYDLLRIANSNYMGKPAATVPEFLELGVKIMPEFIHDPADRRHEELALAESMMHNGATRPAEQTLLAVQADAKSAGDRAAQAEADAFLGPLEAQLGKPANALAFSQEGLDLAQRKLSSQETLVWAQIGYAEVRENAGSQSDANLALLRKAVTEARKERYSDRLVASAQYALASDLEIRGQLDEAEGLIRDDLAIYLREPYAACDQSQMYGDLGFIAGARGNPQDGIGLFKKAYSGSLTCAGPDNPATLTIEDYLAGAMLHAGKPADAVAVMRDALPRWRKLGSGGTDLVNAQFYMALALKDTGQLAEAETVSKDLVANVHAFASPQSHILGSCEQVLAETLIAEGKDREALPHAKLADDVLNKTSHSPAFIAGAKKMHTELLALEDRLGQHEGQEVGNRK